ncbi:MAG: hypothetical protein ACXVAY_20030 [Mucilaginibacter sp.]
MNRRKNIWFALVEVTAENGNTDLGDAMGAFVNVAYQAFNKEDFLTIVEESFKSFDFKVIQVKTIERGDNLLITNPDNAEKLILLNRIKDGDEFAWGTFHTYLGNEYFLP